MLRFRGPAGPHAYAFMGRNLGTTALPEPYVLDTFSCTDQPAC